MTRILAALLAGALLCAGATAQARDLTEDERARLEAALEQMHGAFVQRDAPVLVSLMPSRLLDALAEAKGIPPEEMPAAMRRELETILADGGMDRVRMTGGTVYEAADGEPFVMLDTRVFMTLEDGRRLESKGYTLALMNEEGMWRMANIGSKAMAALLVRAYPRFKGFEFPMAEVSEIE